MQGKMAEMYSALSACRAYSYTLMKAADRDISSVTNHDCASAQLKITDFCFCLPSNQMTIF